MTKELVIHRSKGVERGVITISESLLIVPGLTVRVGERMGSKCGCGIRGSVLPLFDSGRKGNEFVRAITRTTRMGGRSVLKRSLFLCSEAPNAL